MIELVLMASVASSSLWEPSFPPSPPPPPIDSIVLIASVAGSSSAPSPPPVSSTPASGSGSGSQPVTVQQKTPPFQPQQEQPKESWADKMWRRYNENKGRN